MLSRSILPGAYQIEISQNEIAQDVWLGALAELETCTVSQIDEASGNSKNINRIYHPSGPFTRSIVEYLQSERWHQHLVDLANFDQEWLRNWGKLSVNFIKSCRFGWTWHSLRAGYDENDWHVDSLKQIIHGLFYINPKSAAPCNTLFAWDVMGNMQEVLQPTTDLGQGWIILQNGRTFHRGQNLSEKPRFGLKFSYQLWSSNHCGISLPQKINNSDVMTGPVTPS